MYLYNFYKYIQNCMLLKKYSLKQCCKMGAKYMMLEIHNMVCKRLSL